MYTFQSKQSLLISSLESHWYRITDRRWQNITEYCYCKLTLNYLYALKRIVYKRKQKYICLRGYPLNITEAIIWYRCKNVHDCMSTPKAYAIMILGLTLTIWLMFFSFLLNLRYFLHDFYKLLAGITSSLI